MDDLFKALDNFCSGIEAQRAAEQAAKEKAEAEAARLAPRLIARYLTVGTARVEISYTGRTGAFTSVCTGELCAWRNHTDTRGLVTDTAEQEQARFDDFLPVAQEAAQAHAETCRAMPKAGT